MQAVHEFKKKIGLSTDNEDINFYRKAIVYLLHTEQMKSFPEIFSYFKQGFTKLKDIPALVNKYNLFVDTDGIIRVKSKFHKWTYGDKKFPIFLPRDSPLTTLIVWDAHTRLLHAGCYTMLNELRKVYYIPSYFSLVKHTIKSCIHCKRFNARSIKLNQNAYRDFRVDPPQIPFANLFLDYNGPFKVNIDKMTQKVCLLCPT